MDIRIMVISDIHLGHNKNTTANIVNNLNKFLTTYKNSIKTADMFVISGDVFDRLISTNSVDNHLAFTWLTDLLKLCKSYNIKLRILEGTPSHDWKQVKLLYNIINTLNLDLDFRYVEDLSIEYIEEYDMNILYLPDEWKSDIKEIYKDVKNKLIEHNLKKVDMIIMHGAFSYQLPDFIEHTHNPDDYISICDGPIINGHIHTRSIYKNIIVPGSFDNLTHEDDDKEKGGTLITLNTVTHKFKINFLVNKHALLFKTYDVRDKSVTYIKKILNSIKKEAHIRFIVGENSRLSDAILELRFEYPNLHIIIKKDKKEDKKLILRHDKLEAINLDKDFIFNYIIDRADKSIIKEVEDELDSIL